MLRCSVFYMHFFLIVHTKMSSAVKIYMNNFVILSKVLKFSTGHILKRKALLNHHKANIENK